MVQTKEKNNSVKLLTDSNYSFAAYKFTNENDIEFNPTEYSQFKFGSKTIAKKFGTILAERFFKSDEFKQLQELLMLNRDIRVVVMSSPYVHIPTATFAMKDHFVKHLNQKLYHLGYKPCFETKIMRTSSYKSEYGEMSREERLNVMKNDTFFVNAEFLQNNICIYLDDIIITGAHEFRIKKMLNKYKIKNNHNFFLYFARLTDDNTNPKIENYLNYHFVDSLIKLNYIIRNHEFFMNTRLVKYILDANHEECVHFLSYQKKIFNEHLYYEAIGNNYHMIPDYQQNFKFLENMIFNS